MESHSFTRGLGRLVLQSKPANLEASLTNTAHLTIAADPLDNRHQLSQRSYAEMIFNHNRGRCFIRPSAEYRLVMDIHVDQNIGIPLCELVPVLTGSFAEAEIWSQLSVAATSVQATVDTSMGAACINMIVRLEFRHASSQPRHRRKHDLAKDVPYYDIIAPAGIDTLQLDHVQFSIHIKSMATIESSESRNGHYRHSKSELNTDLSSDYHDADLDFDTFVGLSQQADNAQIESDCCSIRDFIEILDAAFRQSIDRNVENIPKHVVIAVQESWTTLSEFAPELWRPRHLSTMASGAVLAPTIAGALARMGARVHNATAHAKWNQLLTRSATAGSSREAIHAQLWRMLAESQYDDKHARNLSPLKPATLARDDFRQDDAKAATSGSAADDAAIDNWLTWRE